MERLILNTEIFNHQYVNREAIVVSTPMVGETDIKPGDTVIVHHNVFRRWHDVKGREKNSRSYFNESTYFIAQDQIFLYKRMTSGKLQRDIVLYTFKSYEINLILNLKNLCKVLVNTLMEQ